MYVPTVEIGKCVPIFDESTGTLDHIGQVLVPLLDEDDGMYFMYSVPDTSTPSGEATYFAKWIGTKWVRTNRFD